jgi:dihydropteroate synthase
MGILNVTPDSFYDGGRYLDPDAARARARRMAEEGADILDVGGQSTRPFSNPVTPEEEMARVVPVLEGLAAEVGLPLSIDTSNARVAERAIELGATILNDVTALTADPGMASLAARTGVGVVLMHMRGTPETMQKSTDYADVTGEVKAYLAGRAAAAEAAGIRPGALVVDPGIGFGKSVPGNLELLRRLPEIAGLGYPVLVGASRKSFIGRLGDLAEGERLEGSLGAAAVAAMNGASIVRVHDVRETVRMLRVVDAVHRGGGEG